LFANQWRCETRINRQLGSNDDDGNDEPQQKKRLENETAKSHIFYGQLQVIGAAGNVQHVRRHGHDAKRAAAPG